MAIPLKQKVSQAEFEHFVEQHENADQRFELIGGEIVEVPSNPFVSKIAMLIGALIVQYLIQHDTGHVTGADGGYIVNGEIYAPDVAYISYERQPELAQKGYNPNPPELAVEVISDPDNSQEQSVLRRKIVNYLNAGTVVWVVDPFAGIVEVYAVGQSVQVLEADATLSGGDVLPGFELALKDILPKSTSK